MTNKQASRRHRGRKPDSEPAILHHLVQIDAANLVNLDLSKGDIEDLVQRLRKYLLNAAGSGTEPESMTTQTGKGAVAVMAAARPPFGGGGNGGGTGDNPIIPGCVLVDVVEAWRVVQGKGRWARVERYSCPNGMTYERII